MVPPYHPASNGAAERVVQTIKDKLKKSQAGDFRTQVARILLQYRTTPHDVTGRASCELLLGRMVKTPLDILHPGLRSTALLKQLNQKLAADKGRRLGPLPETGVQYSTGISVLAHLNLLDKRSRLQAPPLCSYVCRMEPHGTGMLTL
ncbi:uncharacterized protein LOC119405901 [Rhipicephalus sanguineus]|uniref:uncharacterized protein LOC119405901 n=1 Tax=Rhipicephalus sanguineus TaxID=34632 RepID=UPI001895FD10|nr:uncharacterized protein LOC119405901 [Rhipicephalus sanguineus]